MRLNAPFLLSNRLSEHCPALGGNLENSGSRMHRHRTSLPAGSAIAVEVSGLLRPASNVISINVGRGASGWLSLGGWYQGATPNRRCDFSISQTPTPAVQRWHCGILKSYPASYSALKFGKVVEPDSPAMTASGCDVCAEVNLR
jgi:hypothetical protein